MIDRVPPNERLTVRRRVWSTGYDGLPNEPLAVIMTDERISSLRATAHPLRLRMLSLLTSSAMSAAEVARELGITHANASYHLRQLHDADLVVVEGEERIRGGMAKRYRHLFDRPESKWTDEDMAGRGAAGCSAGSPTASGARGRSPTPSSGSRPRRGNRRSRCSWRRRCWCTGRRGRPTLPGPSRKPTPSRFSGGGDTREGPASRAAGRPPVPVVLRLARRRPARRHHG